MKKYIIPSVIAIIILIGVAFAKSSFDSLQNQIRELSQQTPQAMLENVRSEHSTLSWSLSEKSKKIQGLELKLQEEKVEEAKIAQEMKELENKSHALQAVLNTWDNSKLQP